MPKAMTRDSKICKICGKKYEGCRSLGASAAIYDWKAVACCPEHGEKYFALIAESRKKQGAKKASVKKESKKEEIPPPVPPPEENVVIDETALAEEVSAVGAKKSTSGDAVASFLSTM